MKAALHVVGRVGPEEDAEAPQRIPIPGAAGAAIYAALKGLAMHSGDAVLVIRKERLPNGGYTYLIGHNQNPARPVRS